MDLAKLTSDKRLVFIDSKEDLGRFPIILGCERCFQLNI